MKTSLKTLRKHLPYIKNSFIYPYNNGRIEGSNNKINVLHRVAYGYRNFTNFKNRIMLHFKLKPVEVTCNTGHKETHPNRSEERRVGKEKRPRSEANADTVKMTRR